MADYPGNQALAAEVREKILTTFRHTVVLYSQGKKDDAIVGCEFILKMDSRFTPAQKLLGAARSGAPIDAASLLPGDEPTPAPTLAEMGLVDQAREALEARDIARCMQICQEHLAAHPDDPEAMDLGRQAQEIVEAEPFVMQFVQKARAALAAGDTAQASNFADKAWALDSGHPELKAVRASIAEAMAPSQDAFEFDGDSGSNIDIATGDALGGAEPGEAPASEAYGFQFAPEEDISQVPTIDLAPRAASEGEVGGSFAFAAEPGGAPAGFSFETPTPAAPSPTAPPAAPKAAEPAAFDFSAATSLPGQAAGGEDPRVQSLLTEGDRAFETGDYQGALDVWSRIYLIDVTSQVAAERIDRAKKAKADRDRKVEALLAEGQKLYGVGSTAEAKAKFAEVLAIDPSNASARKAVEKIDSGARASAHAGGSLGPATAKPVDAGKDILSDDILGDFVPPPPAPTADQEMFDGGEVPELFPEEPAVTRAPAPAKRAGLPLPIVIAGAAVVLLAAGAVWFFIGRSGGDGGSGDQPASVSGSVLVNNAIALEKLGKIDEALRELAKVPRTDPAYDNALKLLNEIRERHATPATPPTRMVDGRPATEVAAELKEKGKAALEAKRYLEAAAILGQASKLAPGDAEIDSLQKAALEQVVALQTILKQFNEGNYEAAIKLLWPMRQADPANADVERLLFNSYMNLGITELQSGTAEKAFDQFKEALTIRPDDFSAKRHQLLADRYRNRAKDLRYRIYTKYLQLLSS